jgi:hypothetical protein
MKHSETPIIVFFKTTFLMCYLAFPAYLHSQNLQRHNNFSFLKINDKKQKDSGSHTSVQSSQKSLTFSKGGPSSRCDYFCQPNFL